jgi:HAD superfamily hydrolase (TIGR01484 family)
VTLISSNGAVTRSSTGEHFHRDLLPAPVAQRLLRYMVGFRSNTVLTFDRDGKGAIVLETADELNLSIQRWLEKNSEWTEFIVPLEDALTEDPVQAMFCGNIPKMSAVQKMLLDCDFGNQFTVLRTQYDARNLCIVDILNQDCSKGHALQRWTEHRGIPRDQVMAIGDNFNDVEMLQFAGLPVLMANACDELKQNGWTLTLSNDESGVGYAINQVLNPE